MFLLPKTRYARIVLNHEKITFLRVFAVAHGVQATMEMTPTDRYTFSYFIVHLLL